MAHIFKHLAAGIEGLSDDEIPIQAPYSAPPRGDTLTFVDARVGVCRASTESPMRSITATGGSSPLALALALAQTLTLAFAWSDKQNDLIDKACDGGVLELWHKFMINAIQMCDDTDFERGFRTFAANAVKKRGELKSLPRRNDGGTPIDLSPPVEPEPEPEPAAAKTKSKREMRMPLMALFKAHDEKTPSKVDALKGGRPPHLTAAQPLCVALRLALHS